MPLLIRTASCTRKEHSRQSSRAPAISIVNQAVGVDAAISWPQSSIGRPATAHITHTEDRSHIIVYQGIPAGTTAITTVDPIRLATVPELAAVSAFVLQMYYSADMFIAPLLVDSVRDFILPNWHTLSFGHARLVQLRTLNWLTMILVGRWWVRSDRQNGIVNSVDSVATSPSCMTSPCLHAFPQRNTSSHDEALYI